MVGKRQIIRCLAPHHLGDLFILAIETGAEFTPRYSRGALLRVRLILI